MRPATGEQYLGLKSIYRVPPTRNVTVCDDCSGLARETQDLIVESVMSYSNLFFTQLSVWHTPRSMTPTTHIKIIYITPISSRICHISWYANAAQNWSKFSRRNIPKSPLFPMQQHIQDGRKTTRRQRATFKPRVDTDPSGTGAVLQHIQQICSYTKSLILTKISTGSPHQPSSHLAIRSIFRLDQFIHCSSSKRVSKRRDF